MSVNVLFFEPWYGGSHRRFLDAWQARSKHQIRVLGLAPRHWQWRMESSAWELARRAAELDGPPDVIACSDYVDLPRLMGMLPAAWRTVPTFAYFHENQLTYPASGAPVTSYGFTNVLTALRAESLAFNSSFHRDDFQDAATALLRRLPRPNPRAEFEDAIARSQVIPPAPELASVPLGRGAPDRSPLRVVFPHRLEPDKDPMSFVAAVKAAIAEGARLELVFVGGDPSAASSEIRAGLREVEGITTSAGLLESRDDYLNALGSSDVVVSTARHEFFGVAVAEAMAAGCRPLLPNRLAYPEVAADYGPAAIYGTGEELAAALLREASRPEVSRAKEARSAARSAVLGHDAAHAARALDQIMDPLAGSRG